MHFVKMESADREFWIKTFNRLDKRDGEKDGKISCKTLIKWLKSLDVESRVEFEEHSYISLNKIQRLVNEVCFRDS